MASDEELTSFASAETENVRDGGLLRSRGGVDDNGYLISFRSSESGWILQILWL